MKSEKEILEMLAKCYKAADESNFGWTSTAKDTISTLEWVLS